MSGTIALSWGKNGGFYVRRGGIRRLCLGPVALTYIPRIEIDDLMRSYKPADVSTGRAGKPVTILSHPFLAPNTYGRVVDERPGYGKGAETMVTVAVAKELYSGGCPDVDGTVQLRVHRSRVVFGG